MFGQTRVELAYACGQQMQHPVANRRRSENHFPEDIGRHDAEFGLGQRSDIGRTLRAVDGRKLAEELSGAHFGRITSLPACVRIRDSHLAGDDEIDVGGFVLIIDDDLAFIKPPPGTAAVEQIEIKVGDVLEKRNTCKGLHDFRPRRRCNFPGAIILVTDDFSNASQRAGNPISRLILALSPISLLAMY